MTSKAVVVLSGGLDSSTLAHHVAAQGYDVYGISFDYGQRHSKELESACRVVNVVNNLPAGARYDAKHQDLHKVINLKIAGVTELFEGSGSSLVTDTDVPDGHYAEETMKATVVPNRNMIMLSIAAAWAISLDAEGVWIGVHAGDHFIYPDCREEFIYAANAAIVRGNAGFGPIYDYNKDNAVVPQQFVHTPFLLSSKDDIAQMAFDLNVDIANTWSCYKGGDIHCGKCGTCVERQEAIASTGNNDPTAYADTTYWQTVIKGRS